MHGQQKFIKILIFIVTIFQYKGSFRNISFLIGKANESNAILFSICDHFLSQFLIHINFASRAFVNDNKESMELIDIVCNYFFFKLKDQLRRYNEIKQTDMPSAMAAKKTKEFRCPPREQVICLVQFRLILIPSFLILVRTQH